MARAAALVFAGKSVAIPAISFLVTKAFNYLNELEQALPKIQAVFQVINPQHIKEESSALDAWLWQLRDAYEEAEDAVDEVDYYRLKEKAEDHKVSDWGSSFAKRKHRAIRSVMHASVLDKTIKGFTHRGTLKRLRKAVEGLDKAASGAVGFLTLTDHLRGSSTSRQEEDILNKDRETGSMLTAPKVFGRQEDLERVVGCLTKPSIKRAEIEESSISVISIVGHGGMGKTTLAQLVHNDDTINSHFDKVIWACVSTIFNAKDRILGDKLNSVKFLLILDDVWEDKKDDQWEKLLAPLRKGKNGSKILLTTRIKRAAEMAENVVRGENQRHQLQGLDEHANIELFRHHAFLSPVVQDGSAINQTGEQIAKNLRGCPLVTKVVAAHLRDNMRLDYWNEFLTQSLQHFCGSSIDIMNVLKLSYYHLSPELQTCFRYCSLFPQDYRFEKNQIVEMWVNSGLISHDESETSLVSIGEEYMIQLTRKSFFDLRFSVDRLGQADKESGYYVMHDLIHDLATNVSFGECVRIVDVSSFQNVLRTVRHIRVEYIYNFHVEKIRKISCLEHLRTIIINVGNSNEGANIDILNAVEQLVARSKSLHLLDTQLWHKSHFASTLAKLKHLRCIILQNTLTYQESMYEVFKLYHLTTLRWKSMNIGSKQVRDAGYLDRLYKRLQYMQYELIIDNLEPHANLKDLCISGFNGSRIPCWIAKPSIENLVKLRFNCCVRIEELPNLQMLQKLKDLMLDGLTGLRKIGQVLNTLGVRESTLVLLEIRDVGLTRLPRIANLQNGDDGTVSSQLKKIVVIRCQSLNSLEGSLFEQEQITEALREMSIIDCLLLEYAPLPFLDMNGLCELSIKNCPRLRMVRSDEDKLSLSSLKKLEMGQFGDLDLLLLQSLQVFTNLSHLELNNCSVVESLPSADVFESSMLLRHISMNGCVNLSSLGGGGGLRSLPCLKGLFIQILNCQKLTETRLSLASDVSDCHEEPRRIMQIHTISIGQPSLLFVEPLKSLCPTDCLDIGDGSETLDVMGPWLLKNCTSLQDLSIFEANLESLPPTIRELSSLKWLRLYGSGQLHSLSNLPSSLDSLYVSGCHPELQMDARIHGSLEWNKISQIPQVQIGDCYLKYGRHISPHIPRVTWTTEVMNHTDKTQFWSRAFCCPGSQEPMVF
ncbi:hypothetical protein BS78_05G041300 [Paspalum vaginatum]|nr:hypothetical protein BS78_05G041300 [Paspalum vaginatum]KAJ1274159.1 hypothetical protein BS78_05G041300 [Paspalum vaginatum]